MATVNWINASQYNNGTFYNNALGKMSGVSDAGWLGFLDALGRVEGNNLYDTTNNDGYIGIYQFAPIGSGDIFETLGFVNNVGAMLGVTADADYLNNPVAQELSALMEFSGTAPVTNSFSSRYRQVKAAAKNPNYGNLSEPQFNQILDQTVTIEWVDGTNPVGQTQTITLTQAGLSSAGHLVGQGWVGLAIGEFRGQCTYLIGL